MKQTAVEWLRSMYESRPAYEECILDEEWEQAKEMEKKDMIEFAQEVFRNRYNQITQSLGNIADDIYNETYGGDK